MNERGLTNISQTHQKHVRVTSVAAIFIWDGHDWNLRV